MTVPKWQLERLREQLTRAIAKGDHAAELILRARIAATAKSEWSELEKRYAWGDR